MTVAELIAAQRLVRRIPVGESVVEAILTLVRSGRPGRRRRPDTRFVAWGPGPRASQALMLACRARALIDGRYAPSVDDVLALAPPVLRHRMAVSFAGRAEGVTVGRVIDQMVDAAAVIPAVRDRSRHCSRAAPPHRRWRCATAPSMPPRRCRRCWSRPSGSPRRWRRACTAGAASARARPSGNSANTSRATRRAASTGARAPSRSASMSARPNGRRRRASGCGATPRPRWITARPLHSGADWPTKRDRAELLLVALASLLVRGGERLTLLGGGTAPASGRVALSRVVELLGHDRAAGRRACPPSSRCRAPASSC